MAVKKYIMWLVLYGSFFTLGFVLLFFAFQQYQKTQNLLADGIKTTAVVIDLLTNYDSDGNTYTPVFEFKDRNSITRTYKSPISSSPPAHKVGERVKIIYDKTDNENIKTVSFWGLYRASVILLMIASPFLVIGSSYLLYTLK